jgi:mediator of RNA polymerase II transcription subunit 5
MTMYLKQLSSLLFKKPQALDVILQFTSPASILRPLCQILDDWHYDSDQGENPKLKGQYIADLPGEYQPVYDEFGAVLVLAMAIIYRYDLTYHDIGISSDSFVARFIRQKSILPEDMTEEQGKHLGRWLKGLYDSGNEGLSNDVFASCSPQDFYTIVPTLFQQTVMALSAGILSFESVKGGIECELLYSKFYSAIADILDLMETFLLPSLIGGLVWMSSYALTQTHTDLDAILRIFREVIISAPSSGDAQAMHAAILAMVSSQLEKSLRTIQRRDANRANNIEPLMQAVKSNQHYVRSMYASMKELEQWTNAPNNTLHTALRHTVQQLSQWASTASIQPNPTSYTHRQVYASLKLLGAFKVMRAIIDEIKAQTEAGNGAAALDIGVSIICAPTVDDSPIPVDWLGSSIPASHPPRTRMNLREMLKSEFDNAAGLVAIDPLGAETIVRLHRRVEAQLSSIGELALQGQGPAMVGLPTVNINDMATQSISDDLTKAIDDAAAATIADDITSMDNKALQRSMDELTGTEGLDLSSIGMGAVDGSAGELGNLPDLDLGDMSGMGMSMDMDMDMDMAMGGGGDDDWGLDFDNM